MIIPVGKNPDITCLQNIVELGRLCIEMESVLIDKKQNKVSFASLHKLKMPFI